MSWPLTLLASVPPIVVAVVGLAIFVLERGPIIGTKWIEFAERREARRGQRRKR